MHQPRTPRTAPHHPRTGGAHHKDLNQVASKAGVTHAAVMQKLGSMHLESDYISFEQFLTVGQ